MKGGLSRPDNDNDPATHLLAVFQKDKGGHDLDLELFCHSRRTLGIQLYKLLEVVVRVVMIVDQERR